MLSNNAVHNVEDNAVGNTDFSNFKLRRIHRVLPVHDGDQCHGAVVSRHDPQPHDRVHSQAVLPVPLLSAG
jgi:hypothetical protein